ncbi:MAG TPA: lantibiotic dehydratase, partial [Ktedonobacteraceae bacterium]|nr:lantibiotic dehydratase [Ktedonobacteraceae bacterium]
MVIHQEFTHSSTTANRNNQEILLAPYFLMRVTGLPFSIIEQIQFPRTVAIIEELLDLEGRFECKKEALLENLKASCKQISEKEIQHKGLDLQRAIVSQNGLKARKLFQVVASALSEELANETEQWIQYILRSADLLAQGEPTLQEELLENRGKLRAWFAQEDFQQGLLLSSSTLYEELQHYLNAPLEKNNNRLRKAEEGLLSYFVRMLTKTSPYSTFCSTSLGTWSNQPGLADQINVRTWQKQRYVRFHAGLLATIAHHLAAHPEVRPYLYPVLNTTLNWVTEDSLELKQGTDAQQSHEIEKVEIFLQEKVKESKYIYQERLVRIRINTLARELITAIEQAAGTRTYQEILEQVTEKLLDTEGVSSETQDYQKHRERCRQKAQGMLEYLTKYSVIAIDLRIPAQEDDKLTFLIKRLADIPGSWVAGVRDVFIEIHALMETYTHVPAQECAKILPAIRDLVLALCQEIGSHQDASWDARKTVERLYPALILEDTTLPFTALSLEQSNWEPVLHDLQLLQAIAPVLDLGVVTKINMDHWAKEAFAQRPSQTEDLITCHLRFWQEFMNNYELQQKWLRSDPHFIQLRQSQQSFLTLLHASLHQARQQHTSVAQLDSPQLREFARRLPDFLHQHAALAHFGQHFFDGKQPHMVLNATWTGPGTAFSRFSYLFEHLATTGNQLSSDPITSFVETFQAYVRQLGKHHDATYASIAETGEINVNMHAALAPYEILFPMSASQRSREEQITLRDLHVLYHQQKQ